MITSQLTFHVGKNSRKESQRLKKEGNLNENPIERRRFRDSDHIHNDRYHYLSLSRHTSNDTETMKEPASGISFQRGERWGGIC